MCVHVRVCEVFIIDSYCFSSSVGVDEGAFITPLSFYNSEKEVLLPAFSKFIVDEVRPNERNHQVRRDLSTSFVLY